MEATKPTITISTSLRILTLAEQALVEAALTINRQGGGEETAIILDPATTALKGVGKVDPIAKSIRAIKDLPVHYHGPGGARG